MSTAEVVDPVAPMGTPTVYSVHVGNLAYQLNSADLLKCIGCVVVPCFCMVCRMENGRSKGFGFLSFKSQIELEEARHRLDGMVVRGRRMFIEATNINNIQKAVREWERWGHGGSDASYDRSEDGGADGGEERDRGSGREARARYRKEMRDRERDRDRDRYDRDMYMDRDRGREMPPPYVDRYERDRHMPPGYGGMPPPPPYYDPYHMPPPPPPPYRSSSYGYSRDPYDRSHRENEEMARELRRQKYENMLLREQLQREEERRRLETSAFEDSYDRLRLRDVRSPVSSGRAVLPKERVETQTFFEDDPE